MLVVYPSGYWEVIPLECLTDCVEPQGPVDCALIGLPLKVCPSLGL